MKYQQLELGARSGTAHLVDLSDLVTGTDHTMYVIICPNFEDKIQTTTFFNGFPVFMTNIGEWALIPGYLQGHGLAALHFLQTIGQVGDTHEIKVEGHYVNDLLAEKPWDLIDILNHEDLVDICDDGHAMCFYVDRLDVEILKLTERM